MEPQRLGDLPADAVDRVEGRHRVLEDHPDPVAPQLLQLRLAELGEFDSVEANRALDDSAGRRKEPHDAEGSHRLATSRLADDAEDLARMELEGDALDCLHNHPGASGSTYADLAPRATVRRRPSCWGNRKGQSRWAIAVVVDSVLRDDCLRGQVGKRLGCRRWGGSSGSCSRRRRGGCDGRRGRCARLVSSGS